MPPPKVKGEPLRPSGTSPFRGGFRSARSLPPLKGEVPPTGGGGVPPLTFALFVQETGADIESAPTTRLSHLEYDEILRFLKSGFYVCAADDVDNSITNSITRLVEKYACGDTRNIA